MLGRGDRRILAGMVRVFPGLYTAVDAALVPRVRPQGRAASAAVAAIAILAVSCASGEEPIAVREPEGLPSQACHGVVPDEVSMEVTGRDRGELERYWAPGFGEEVVGQCTISDGQGFVLSVAIEEASSALFDGRRERALEEGAQEGPMPDSWVQAYATEPSYHGEWLIHRGADAGDGHSDLVTVAVLRAPDGHDAMADAALVLEHLGEFYEERSPRSPSEVAGET